MLKCPHCNKVIPMALFTTFIGKIGGVIGGGFRRENHLTRESWRPKILGE